MRICVGLPGREARAADSPQLGPPLLKETTISGVESAGIKIIGFRHRHPGDGEPARARQPTAVKEGSMALDFADLVGNRCIQFRTSDL